MIPKREWLVIPLLSLLLLVPFWQVATMQGVIITNDIAISDMANLHHPERHFIGRELHAGRLPLWSPDIYMGYPVQAEALAGVFYPPNLLLFGLLPPLPALNLSVLLPLFIAAFATYALARSLGAACWPSLIAALAYALGGFYIVHTKQMSIIDTACWIPLGWWAIERGLVRDRRWLLLTSLLWAIQWTAGSPQIAYYGIGSGLLYYVGRALQMRRLRATIPLMALAFVLCFGLAAVQIWPTVEMTAFSERSGGVNFEFASAFGYRLASLKTFVYPYSNGDPGTANYKIAGLFWEDYAYIGLLPLAASLVGGLWLARRDGLARLLLLLAGATFVIALGKNTPFFRLAYDWLPGMRYFRFPQRLQAVTTLCLSLLAALALTGLQRSVGQRFKPGKQHWLGLLALALVTADLYFYHIRHNAIIDAQTWYDPPQSAQRIQQDDGLYRYFTYGAVSKFHQAYNQARGWQSDLQPYVAQREFLQPSLNILYDVSAVDGYANLTPDYLTQVWGNEKQVGFIEQMFVRANDRLLALPGFSRLLSLYNVRYLITPLPFEGDGFDLLGVYGPDAHLYENINVLPRAFIVPSYTLAADVPAALDAMVSFNFDPSQQVVLFDTPEFSHAQPAGSLAFTASHHVVRYEPLHVVIETRTNAAGLLVLSDTYYPGWQATVDGQSVPIYQANACVRAVPLGAGAHRVEFRFAPKPLVHGVWVSAGCCLLLLGALWLAKPKLASNGPKPCSPGASSLESNPL